MAPPPPLAGCNHPPPLVVGIVFIDNSLIIQISLFICQIHPIKINYVNYY